MESSISLALAAQVALRRRMDVVANNLANAGTAGFKLEAQIVQPQPQPGGESEVDYPLDRGTYTDLRPGPITLSGNPLDVAVAGDEMLAVQTPGGLRYTRDGRMTRAADGTLLGLSGHPVAAAGGGTIAVPEQTRTITIAGDGTVTADGEELGQIGMFALPPGTGLRRQADGLFTVDGIVEPAPEGRLQQGAIEQSNVQPIQELVDMMELQRGYERVQRLLDGEDERIRKLVDNAVKA
jgi:flagellar basal-body rod protein FlgF